MPKVDESDVFSVERAVKTTKRLFIARCQVLPRGMSNDAIVCYSHVASLRPVTDLGYTLKDSISILITHASNLMIYDTVMKLDGILMYITEKEMTPEKSTPPFETSDKPDKSTGSVEYNIPEPVMVQAPGYISPELMKFYNDSDEETKKRMKETMPGLDWPKEKEYWNGHSPQALILIEDDPHGNYRALKVKPGWIPEVDEDNEGKFTIRFVKS